jgi:hypothetical protein
MIWTVMLGLLLTSVFFFFSMRERMMLSVQRDTAAIQNAKLLLGSYADYLEKYPTENPSGVDGVTVKLTKKMDSIESVADFGPGKQQTYDFNGSIYVEWNKCVTVSQDRKPDSTGDLLLNDVLNKHLASSTCEANEDYADVVGPISVTDTFTIKTLNTPFYFRIKPVSGQLTDNRWHLDLTEDLDYGKKITISRTFE